MYTATEEKMMVLMTERDRLFDELRNTENTSIRRIVLLGLLTENQNKHDALCDTRLAERGRR